MALQVLDDDAGLADARVLLHQQRHLAEWPQRPERLALDRVAQVQQPRIQRCAQYARGDQHFLAAR
ncbi:hypothetical protein [Stenotrophomonas sp.]|uniref:hypothetical protein n=1 Tax=Stenotrophomonas sp. TaxID=69392 RepID=UPI00257E868B|nr:hypothetical protein [Stenotrophomonas sp.]